MYALAHKDTGSILNKLQNKWELIPLYFFFPFKIAYLAQPWTLHNLKSADNCFHWFSSATVYVFKDIVSVPLIFIKVINAFSALGVHYIHMKMWIDEMSRV